MLILSRRKNERVVIGDDIVVTVTEIRGDKVRLGFEAPEEVPVHREEFYKAIQKKGREAVEVKNGRNGSSHGESANRRPHNNTPSRNGRKRRRKKSRANGKEVK